MGPQPWQLAALTRQPCQYELSGPGSGRLGGGFQACVARGRGSVGQGWQARAGRRRGVGVGRVLGVRDRYERAAAAAAERMPLEDSSMRAHLDGANSEPGRTGQVRCRGRGLPRAPASVDIVTWKYGAGLRPGARSSIRHGRGRTGQRAASAGQAAHSVAASRQYGIPPGAGRHPFDYQAATPRVAGVDAEVLSGEVPGPIPGCSCP